MFYRLLNILKSLSTNDKIKENEVSTSIDDLVEGHRQTFDKDTVQKLLEEKDLNDEEQKDSSDRMRE